MRLHRHRSDLRAPDYLGLSAAADDGPVLPVFIFDDEILGYGSPPRVAFMLDALAELRSWYRERGGDLLVARGDPATGSRRTIPRSSLTRRMPGTGRSRRSDARGVRANQE